MGFELRLQKIMTSTLGVRTFIITGKDFTEYNKDFRLRTDAVWEKTQLKDWFRLANKVTLFILRSSSSTKKIANIT